MENNQTNKTVKPKKPHNPRPNKKENINKPKEKSLTEQNASKKEVKVPKKDNKKPVKAKTNNNKSTNNNNNKTNKSPVKKVEKNNKPKKQPIIKHQNIKVYSLGGLGVVGMNMYVVEVDDEIIVLTSSFNTLTSMSNVSKYVKVIRWIYEP